MVVYWSGCILSVILISFIRKRIKENEIEDLKPKQAILYALLSGLPLIFISSIRYDVGKDYLAYKARFIQIANGGKVIDFEWLYSLLNQTISRLGGDYRWLFAITSTLFVLFVILAIYKDSPIPELSIYLLVTTTYYFSAMNGIRQMLACSILIFSTRYISDQKIVRFLICVFFASGFHSSSLLFIIVYFLYKKNISRKFVIFSTIVMATISPLVAIIINYMTSFTKYYWYLESTYAETRSVGYITMIMGACVLIFALLYYDEEDQKYQLYVKMQMISFWLAFLVDKVPLIQRVKWIFGLPVIILIPYILSKVSDQKTKIIIEITIVLLYGVYFYYSVGINNSNTVLPYKTIFEMHY